MPVSSLCCLLPLMPHYPLVYLYTLLSTSEAFLAGAAKRCQSGKECPFWGFAETMALVPGRIATLSSVAGYVSSGPPQTDRMMNSIKAMLTAVLFAEPQSV